jgi:hypothetical protein
MASMNPPAITPRKRSTPSTSNQETSTGHVSFREGKNPSTKNYHYEDLLASVRVFMDRPQTYPEITDTVTTNAEKAFCKTLLDGKQPAPSPSLFQDDLFEITCGKIGNRNEARVIQDISRLIVPSAETLATYGARHLDILIETVNECWARSIPLIVNSPRPQPDYSVGLRVTAFTSEQLEKLKSLTGGWGIPSRLMATDSIYFPFFTCEVKCGNQGLNIADRQNAHSASVAANGMIELYQAVKREQELHQKILVFSISHDNRAVRIYGYYALIMEGKVSFYRYPLRDFSIIDQEGKEKWTAYQFTRNVYESFFPIHLKRICSAIDNLPDPDLFLVEELSQQSESREVPSQQPESQEVPSQQSQQASNSFTSGMKNFEIGSAPSSSQDIEPKTPSQTTEPAAKKPKAKQRGPSSLK